MSSLGSNSGRLDCCEGVGLWVRGEVWTGGVELAPPRYIFFTLPILLFVMLSFSQECEEKGLATTETSLHKASPSQT